MTMGTIVYLLCAVAALVCSVLLLRAYRRTGTRLLLWSGLCFGFLTLNNVLVAVDLVIFPDVDLFMLRNVSALAGVVALLYGLIWEAR
jgi:hypothetical protein